MALVVACAAIPADHGALHVRRADLLGARHQRRDAMPGVALWIITVDADQSDQRIAIMMLVPRGREQRLAPGNRRIIVLPDPQAAERHFGSSAGHTSEHQSLIPLS